MRVVGATGLGCLSPASWKPQGSRVALVTALRVIATVAVVIAHEAQPFGL
jgi:hypothetical protein